MPRTRTADRTRLYAELADILAGKLRPPLALALGAPGDVWDILSALPASATESVVCYQMDLFMADQVRESLTDLQPNARVCAAADLWDLTETFQTLIYPVPLGGERELKLDVIEQAYHVLRPGGTFVVVSPFEKDEFFPQALKKIFGKVHAPMAGKNAVLWCQRTGDRPRRRHEVRFHVRVAEDTSYSFLSRPGTFSYGRFDYGARALTEIMEVHPNDRILDLGCGCGTNGILAARQAGPGAFVTFVDSNLRALALAEINARALGVPAFDTLASHTLQEVAEAAYDLVLANPPYFAQSSIARSFIACGQRALKPGGRFFLVTKQVEQVYGMMEEAFGPVEGFEHRGYVVFAAKR